MGQAKNNPKSILKKQGLLPPKKPNMSAVERQILMEESFNRTYAGLLGLLSRVTKEQK